MFWWTILSPRKFTTSHSLSGIKSSSDSLTSSASESFPRHWWQKRVTSKSSPRQLRRKNRLHDIHAKRGCFLRKILLQKAHFRASVSSCIEGLGFELTSPTNRTRYPANMDSLTKLTPALAFQDGGTLWLAHYWRLRPEFRLGKQCLSPLEARRIDEAVIRPCLVCVEARIIESGITNDK